MERMRIRVRFTGPLLFVIFAVSLFTLSAVASAQWASTSTQAVGPALVSATDQGALATSTPIHVNLALQIQNRSALVTYLQSITTQGNPLYGSELDPSTFATYYAPSTSQVQ